MPSKCCARLIDGDQDDSGWEGWMGEGLGKTEEELMDVDTSVGITGETGAWGLRGNGNKYNQDCF